MASLSDLTRSLASLGFFLDQELTLRQQGTERPFCDVEQEGSLSGEVLAELSDIVAQFAVQFLCSRFDAMVLQLPLDGGDDMPKVPIIVSRNWETCDYLCLLSSPSRLGLWSRGVCFDDSLANGSMIATVSALSRKGMGFIILNAFTNEVRSPDGSNARVRVPENETPAKHFDYVRVNLLRRVDASAFFLLGLSFGAQVLLEGAPYIGDAVKCIAVCEGSTTTGDALSHEAVAFCQSRAINWQLSPEARGTLLYTGRESPLGIVCLSAGKLAGTTQENPALCVANALPVIARFFAYGLRTAPTEDIATTVDLDSPASQQQMASQQQDQLLQQQQPGTGIAGDDGGESESDLSLDAFIAQEGARAQAHVAQEEAERAIRKAAEASVALRGNTLAAPDSPASASQQEAAQLLRAATSAAPGGPDEDADEHDQLLMARAREFENIAASSVAAAAEASAGRTWRRGSNPDNDIDGRGGGGDRQSFVSNMGGQNIPSAAGSGVIEWRPSESGDETDLDDDGDDMGGIGGGAGGGEESFGHLRSWSEAGGGEMRTRSGVTYRSGSQATLANYSGAGSTGRVQRLGGDEGGDIAGSDASRKKKGGGSNAAIANPFHSKRKKNLQRSDQWMKDKDAVQCLICSKRFTARRRRHHCRCCGRIFCAPCSARRIPEDRLPPWALCLAHKSSTATSVDGAGSANGGGSTQRSSMSMTEPDLGDAPQTGDDNSQNSNTGKRRGSIKGAPASSGGSRKNNNKASAERDARVCDECAAPSVEYIEPPPTEGGWVIVYGRNLGAQEDDVRVTVGDHDPPLRCDVQVRQAHAELLVEIPEGSGQGNLLTVHVEEPTAEKTTNLVLIGDALFPYAAPLISECSMPQTEGGELRIEGRNFGTRRALAKVRVRGMNCPIRSVQPSEILVEVPSGCGRAVPINVTVDGLSTPAVFDYAAPVLEKATWVFDNDAAVRNAWEKDHTDTQPRMYVTDGSPIVSGGVCPGMSGAFSANTIVTNADGVAMPVGASAAQQQSQLDSGGGRSSGKHKKQASSSSAGAADAASAASGPGGSMRVANSEIGLVIKGTSFGDAASMITVEVGDVRATRVELLEPHSLIRCCPPKLAPAAQVKVTVHVRGQVSNELELFSPAKRLNTPSKHMDRIRSWAHGEEDPNWSADAGGRPTVVGDRQMSTRYAVSPWGVSPFVSLFQLVCESRLQRVRGTLADLLGPLRARFFQLHGPVLHYKSLGGRDKLMVWLTPACHVDSTRGTLLFPFGFKVRYPAAAAIHQRDEHRSLEEDDDPYKLVQQLNPNTTSERSADGQNRTDDAAVLAALPEMHEFTLAADSAEIRDAWVESIAAQILALGTDQGVDSIMSPTETGPTGKQRSGTIGSFATPPRHAVDFASVGGGGGGGRGTAGGFGSLGNAEEHEQHLAGGSARPPPFPMEPSGSVSAAGGPGADAGYGKMSSGGSFQQDGGGGGGSAASASGGGVRDSRSFVPPLSPSPNKRTTSTGSSERQSQINQQQRPNSTGSSQDWGHLSSLTFAPGMVGADRGVLRDEQNRAVWLPDDHSDRCTICRTKFTMLSRRHHCRQCGQLVCAKCSPHLMVVHGFTQKQRGCNRCHSEALSVVGRVEDLEARREAIEVRLPQDRQRLAEIRSQHALFTEQQPEVLKQLQALREEVFPSTVGTPSSVGAKEIVTMGEDGANGSAESSADKVRQQEKTYERRLARLPMAARLLSDLQSELSTHSRHVQRLLQQHNDIGREILLMSDTYAHSSFLLMQRQMESSVNSSVVIRRYLPLLHAFAGLPFFDADLVVPEAAVGVQLTGEQRREQERREHEQQQAAALGGAADGKLGACDDSEDEQQQQDGDCSDEDMQSNHFVPNLNCRSFELGGERWVFGTYRGKSCVARVLKVDLRPALESLALQRSVWNHPPPKSGIDRGGAQNASANRRDRRNRAPDAPSSSSPASSAAAEATKSSGSFAVMASEEKALEEGQRLRRFVREATVLSSLQALRRMHLAILPVVAAGVYPNPEFLQIGRVDGETKTVRDTLSSFSQRASHSQQQESTSLSVDGEEFSSAKPATTLAAESAARSAAHASGASHAASGVDAAKSVQSAPEGSIEYLEVCMIMECVGPLVTLEQYFSGFSTTVTSGVLSTSASSSSLSGMPNGGGGGAAAAGGAGRSGSPQNHDESSEAVSCSYKAQPISNQLLQCVYHLHEQGIVHRDLGLQTVLVDGEGERVAVIGLGCCSALPHAAAPVLAALQTDQLQTFPNLAAVSASSASVIGPTASATADRDAPLTAAAVLQAAEGNDTVEPFTPRHLWAPEVQASGSNMWDFEVAPDLEKSDMWALGVVLFKLIYGVDRDLVALGGSTVELATSCNGKEVDHSTLDLMRKLLAISTRRRVTAREALHHRYFTVSAAQRLEADNEIFHGEDKILLFRAQVDRLTRPEGASLPITLSRERTVAYVLRSANRWGERQMLSQLDVTYEEEDGEDAGGLSKDLFRAFFERVVAPELGYFEQPDSGNEGNVFLPANGSNATRMRAMPSGVMEGVGKVILKALLDGYLIAPVLAPTVFKFLLDPDHIPTLQDLRAYDPQLAQSLQKHVLDVEITPDYAEAAELNFESVGGEHGLRGYVTEDNKSLFVQLRARFVLVESRREQLEQIRAGFCMLDLSQTALKRFNARDLAGALQGPDDLSYEDLIDSINFSEGGWSRSRPSQTLDHLRQYLRNQDTAGLKRFVRFVTGSPNLPHGGLTAYDDPIVIKYIPGATADRLPTAHTCFNSLDLPDYEDYDLLCDKLNDAILGAGDTFGIE